MQGTCVVCGGSASNGRLWYPTGGGVQYPIMFEMLCDKEECARRSHEVGAARGLRAEDHRGGIDRALERFDRFRRHAETEPTP